MNEKLNMEACTIAVESLFSNGTVKFYLIVAESVKKMLEDQKCKPGIAHWFVPKMQLRIILDISQMSLYLGLI